MSGGAGYGRRVAILELGEFEDAVAAIDGREAWQPVLLRLRPGELPQMAALCAARHIDLQDTFRRQLEELAAVRLPAGDASQRREFVQAALHAAGAAECAGNWVYLPWQRVVAHILDADSYFDVITNRNHDKITRAEQRLLRGKCIGVMGLSVGAEAAVCVAQEHLCGSIVLADFDHLDLSNVNRIGAGVDELGQRKTTLAARRIVRIDPYLEVRVLDEGVTEENAASFLEGLDLLIEECDGMRLKHHVRKLAHDRRLNIIFAADERGFLSVEPYAYRQDLPPFHGRITQPPRAREAFATPLDFYRALCEWMGGWSWISARSRASLERVGTTLCGYPQLASEARFAAGQLGHVARRLLLGEQLAPYLGTLDLAEVLPAP